MCLFFLCVVVVVCTRVLSSFLGFFFQSAEFLLPPFGLFRILLGFWKLCLSDWEGNVLSNSALAWEWRLFCWVHFPCVPLSMPFCISQVVGLLLPWKFAMTFCKSCMSCTQARIFLWCCIVSPCWANLPVLSSFKAYNFFLIFRHCERHAAANLGQFLVSYGTGMTCTSFN